MRRVTDRRNDATDHHHRARRRAAHHHRLGGPRCSGRIHGRVHPLGGSHDLRDQSGPRKALYQSQLEQNLLRRHPAGHRHPAAATNGDATAWPAQLARARLATAKYATNLRAAKADGYQIITRMIPDMGYHYLNPTIEGFDVTKPPILVYERHGRSWQLGRVRVGLHREASHPAAAGRDLWVVRGGVPLQGRDVRGRCVPGSVRQAQPPDRRRLQLLAPGPGDPARVAVVPEPGRPLQRHQPLHQALQPRLDHHRPPRPGAGSTQASFSRPRPRAGGEPRLLLPQDLR